MTSSCLRRRLDRRQANRDLIPSLTWIAVVKSILMTSSSLQEILGSDQEAPTWHNGFLLPSRLTVRPASAAFNGATS